MDQPHWWIIDVLLPIILLIVLVWLVFLRRSNGTEDRTGDGRRELNAEERRPRDGTDEP